MAENTWEISVDRFEDDGADRSFQHRLKQFDQENETGAERQQRNNQKDQTDRPIWPVDARKDRFTTVARKQHRSAIRIGEILERTDAFHQGSVGDIRAQGNVLNDFFIQLNSPTDFAVRRGASTLAHLNDSMGQRSSENIEKLRIGARFTVQTDCSGDRFGQMIEHACEGTEKCSRQRSKGSRTHQR